MRSTMTKNFVEQNGITVERLKGMNPGDEIGPFAQGLMVNPNIRKGAPRSGYQDVLLFIMRFSDNGLWGIKDIISKGSSIGPDWRGVTAEEILEELESDEHCVPGEIKNLGE